KYRGFPTQDQQPYCFDCFFRHGFCGSLEGHERARKVKNCETLDRFDVVPFDAYPQRPLNCIDGYDQLTLSASRNENSFDTIQGAATDAHTLPDLEKGMGTVR